MICKEKKALIPYETLSAASLGEPLAMEAVLKYYDGYINALASQPYFDAEDCVHFYVDDTLRQRLQAKLISAVLKFDASREC